MGTVAGVFEIRLVGDGRQPCRIEVAGVDSAVAALPLTKPVACRSIRVREQELLPRLRGAQESVEVLAALRGAGIDGPDPTVVAAAIGAATSAAEIVALDEGRLLPGAVAVFCSARGDVVTVPSMAADGGRWLTLAPATPHRVGLACADLFQRRRAAR